MSWSSWEPTARVPGRRGPALTGLTSDSRGCAAKVRRPRGGGRTLGAMPSRTCLAFLQLTVQSVLMMGEAGQDWHSSCSFVMRTFMPC